MPEKDAYGDWIPQLKKKYPTEKEMIKIFGNQMYNDRYGEVMNGYLMCVQTFMS